MNSLPRRFIDQELSFLNQQQRDVQEVETEQQKKPVDELQKYREGIYYQIALLKQCKKNYRNQPIDKKHKKKINDAIDMQILVLENEIRRQQNIAKQLAESDGL